MPVFTKPNIITKPFAITGDKVAIGETADPAIANQETGYPVDQSTPLEAGGVPVNRPQMNGVTNLYSQHIAWLNAGGSYSFEAKVATAGGYNKDAILYYIAPTGEMRLLRSTKDNNTDNFITTPAFIGTSWIDALLADITDSEGFVSFFANQVANPLRAVYDSINQVISLFRIAAGGTLGSGFAFPDDATKAPRMFFPGNDTTPSRIARLQDIITSAGGPIESKYIQLTDGFKIIRGYGQIAIGTDSINIAFSVAFSDLTYSCIAISNVSGSMIDRVTLFSTTQIEVHSKDVINGADLTFSYVAAGY